MQSKCTLCRNPLKKIVSIWVETDPEVEVISASELKNKRTKIIESDTYTHIIKCSKCEHEYYNQTEIGNVGV